MLNSMLFKAQTEGVLFNDIIEDYTREMAYQDAKKGNDEDDGDTSNESDSDEEPQ